MLKISVAFVPYGGVRACVCVCVCVCVGGSRRYNYSNIYYDDPDIGYSITCVDRPRCWRMGQWLQMHFTLTTRVGSCAKYRWK